MKTTDFIRESIGEDADAMHKDHEVQMARADCYNAAKNAIELHKMLSGISEMQGLEGWVSEKITLANDYLKTVREYLEYEAMSQQQSMLPEFTFESAEQQFNQMLNEDELNEDWKSALAGGALAASMALGGAGGAHAQDVPRDAPAATAQADAPVPLSQRYTKGIDFSGAAYTITADGKEYKWGGRDAEYTGKGQIVTVPASLIGIRGLKPVQVILAPDGKYYHAPTNEGVDFDKIRQDAEAHLKTSLDKQSDERIAKAREPKPGFMQQVGQKQIGMIKGAFKGAAKGLRGEKFEEGKKPVTEMTAGGTGAGAMGAVVKRLGEKGQGPGTGVPKKVNNVLRRTAPKIGKGIY